MWNETGIGGHGMPCGWTGGLEKQHVLSVGAILVWVGVAWHEGKGRCPLRNSGGLLQDPQLLRAGKEEDVTWGHCVLRPPRSSTEKEVALQTPGDEQRK